MSAAIPGNPTGVACPQTEFLSSQKPTRARPDRCFRQGNILSAGTERFTFLLVSRSAGYSYRLRLQWATDPAPLGARCPGAGAASGGFSQQHPSPAQFIVPTPGLWRQPQTNLDRRKIDRSRVRSPARSRSFGTAPRSSLLQPPTEAGLRELRRRPAAVSITALSSIERERLAVSRTAAGRPEEGVRPSISLIGTKETAP